MKAILIIFIFLSTPLVQASCPQNTTQSQQLKTLEDFVSKALYALHIQLSNPDFQSEEAYTKRSQIFDTAFNTPYWSSKLNNKNGFHTLWNWVRFQYWGLIRQQGLLKEDQGYRVTKESHIRADYSKIINFPLYPYVSQTRPHKCDRREQLEYPCSQNIYAMDVILSPTLACSSPVLQNSLTIQVLVSSQQSDWSILDIQFKGRALVKDSFLEFENQLNRSGMKQALLYF